VQNEDLAPTRDSLLHRLKDWDDQSSWQEFFNLYWKLIYGVALKAGLNDAEAQDVVQETIMSVAKNLKDFQIGAEHGSFKAWLLKTTRWRIADQVRKRLPVSASKVDDSTARTSTAHRVPDPASLEWDALWECDWQRTVMEAALANLRGAIDPEEYQIFDLQVFKELSALEVARRMKVKLARVYFVKHKVARLLKREIKRLETVAPWSLRVSKGRSPEKH
jgi:RNA polymerase sigma-70 factor (ECF subfamily)